MKNSYKSSRRETLKKISMGAAWTTPVVNSLVLPLHAQTSPAFTCSIVADFSAAAPSGDISNINVTISPTPENSVLLTYRVEASGIGTLATESSSTDASGRTNFSDVSLPDTLIVGSTVLTIRVFQNPTLEQIGLEPCAISELVD